MSVWVQLHHGPSGRDGTDNVIKVDRARWTPRIGFADFGPIPRRSLFRRKTTIHSISLWDEIVDGWCIFWDMTLDEPVTVKAGDHFTLTDLTIHRREDPC